VSFGSRWLAAGWVVLLGCGGSADEPDGAAAPDSAPAVMDRTLPRAAEGVALVDSLPWANLLEEGVRHRVRVQTAGRVDTIPGIAVTREPVAAEDGAIHGFAVEPDGSVSSGFAYDPSSGGVTRIALPDDFLDFTAFALSPGARYVAYVGRAADGQRLAGVLRRWPGGEVVYRGDPVDGYPSDAANSDVEWHGTDSVEIRIRTADVETPGGTWLRLRGVPGSEMLADTVRGSGE